MAIRPLHGYRHARVKIDSGRRPWSRIAMIIATSALVWLQIAPSAAAAERSATWSCQTGGLEPCTMVGSWIEEDARHATLEIKGINPAAVETAFEAHWSSPWVDLRDAETFIGSNFTAVNVDGGPASLAGALRVRFSGEEWGRWWTSRSQIRQGVNGQAGGWGLLVPIAAGTQTPERMQVQWRLRGSIAALCELEGEWTVAI